MQPLEFKVKVCTWCKIHCAGIKMKNDKKKKTNAIVSIYPSIKNKTAVKVVKIYLRVQSYTLLYLL